MVAARGRCPSQVSDLGGRIKGRKMVVAKGRCYCNTGSKGSGVVWSTSSLSEESVKTGQGETNPKVGANLDDSQL